MHADRLLVGGVRGAKERHAAQPNGGKGDSVRDLPLQSKPRPGFPDRWPWPKCRPSVRHRNRCAATAGTMLLTIALAYLCASQPLLGRSRLHVTVLNSCKARGEPNPSCLASAPAQPAGGAPRHHLALASRARRFAASTGLSGKPGPDTEAAGQPCTPGHAWRFSTPPCLRLDPGILLVHVGLQLWRQIAGYQEAVGSVEIEEGIPDHVHGLRAWRATEGRGVGWRGGPDLEQRAPGSLG